MFLSVLFVCLCVLFNVFVCVVLDLLCVVAWCVFDSVNVFCVFVRVCVCLNFFVFVCFWSIVGCCMVCIVRVCVCVCGGECVCVYFAICCAKLSGVLFVCVVCEVVWKFMFVCACVFRV